MSTEPIFYGACGVGNCAVCRPIYDLDNNPVTDNEGRPLGPEQDR